MKFLPALAGAAGLVLIGVLVARVGVGPVAAALAAIGWPGFAAICLIHLGLIAVMGLAWWALLPQARVWVMIWGRLVRDSAAEVLPLSQVGGFVLGARAATLGGVTGSDAAASTIVDVTLELFAQLAYTALGLLWLVHLRPQTTVAAPVAGGLAAAAILAAGFVAAQHRGFDLLGRLGRHIGQGWAERGAAGAAALHRVIGAIYRRRLGLWASFALHFGCWLASAVEVWLALRLAGAPLGFGAVLAIESLIYAARSIAFAVPNSLGVQEAAYLLLGAGFGLTPPLALALSLLKRARDLCIGVPALGAWQLAEGGRLWRRRSGGRVGCGTTATAKPRPQPAGVSTVTTTTTTTTMPALREHTDKSIATGYYRGRRDAGR
ncbi:MAG TPA: lysylphosphatidylglycerol synthase domain-containing protein [Stellaceae bacterium]